MILSKIIELFTCLAEISTVVFLYFAIACLLGKMMRTGGQ